MHVISFMITSWIYFVGDFCRYHGIHHLSKSHYSPFTFSNKHFKKPVCVCVCFILNFLVTTYWLKSCQCWLLRRRKRVALPRFGYIIGINGNVVTEVLRRWFCCHVFGVCEFLTVGEKRLISKLFWVSHWVCKPVVVVLGFPFSPNWSCKQSQFHTWNPNDPLFWLDGWSQRMEDQQVPAL